MSSGRTASSLNCGVISPVFFFLGCCVCLLVPGMQSLTSYTLSKHSVSEPLPGLCQRVSGIHQKMGLYKKAMALASRFFLLLPLNGNMWAGRDSDGLRVIFPSWAPNANLSRTQLSPASRQALQLSHRLCADSQARSGRRGNERRWKRAGGGRWASSLLERQNLAVCSCQEQVRHKPILGRLFALWSSFSHRNKAPVEVGSLPGSRELY